MFVVKAYLPVNESFGKLPLPKNFTEFRKQDHDWASRLMSWAGFNLIYADSDLDPDLEFEINADPDSVPVFLNLCFFVINVKKRIKDADQMCADPMRIRIRNPDPESLT